MKFAVSNIAWTYAERLTAYALLQDHGFTALEIAPGLLFAEEADAFAPSQQGLRARVAEFERFGLHLVSMQALLFGANGAKLFGTAAEVERLVQGLNRAIELAGALGIGNLVFGSPKQRNIPEGMERDEAISQMRELILPLADLSVARNTVLALEPNAVEYGTNFMTSFTETLAVVRAIDHPGVTLNLDVGALYMTDDFGNIAAHIADAGTLVSHVHISNTHLAPAPTSIADARVVLGSLAANGYRKAVSIEMKAVNGDHLTTLTAAVGRLREAAQAGHHM